VVRAASAGARTAEHHGRTDGPWRAPGRYGADGGARGPVETSRNLRARAHGKGVRLGRCAGADAEVAGTQARRAARATSRRSGALA
jgi:hypothetical protein